MQEALDRHGGQRRGSERGCRVFTWKEGILELKGQLALDWELGMHGSGFHYPALYKPDLVGSTQEVETVELGCSRSPSAPQ